MPDEPDNSKIEELLKAYARKRGVLENRARQPRLLPQSRSGRNRALIREFFVAGWASTQLRNETTPRRDESGCSLKMSPSQKIPNRLPRTIRSGARRGQRKK